ncbi:MAG: hypothetical protein IJT30_02570 [Muribaculaceae bacterium]|nr:hypothetical protein [Muribaculaceae bacterium]
MKLLFTLDYELFLGSRTGSVANCLITPMEQLQAAIESAGGKFTIFVDATYLFRARQLSIGYPQLARDVEQISSHLKQLVASGHDVQLHIHPHWAFSTYNDGMWLLDHKHYKLCDLDAETALQVTTQAKELLDTTIGRKTIAFRAGGFAAQPTAMLKELFLKNDIVADCSVCPGLSYSSPQQEFDYTKAPAKDCYRFDDDICTEDAGGRFTEFPITMHRVSPVFHWKLAANRLLKLQEHRTFGDGAAVKTTGESIVARLTSWQNCQATIDGYKISFLPQAWQATRHRGNELLTILGHPKLATPYSIDRLAKFVQQATAAGDTFTTISQMLAAQ